MLNNETIIEILKILIPIITNLFIFKKGYNLFYKKLKTEKIYTKQFEILLELNYKINEIEDYYNQNIQKIRENKKESEILTNMLNETYSFNKKNKFCNKIIFEKVKKLLFKYQDLSMKIKNAEYFKNIRKQTYEIPSKQEKEIINEIQKLMENIPKSIEIIEKEIKKIIK